MTEGRISVFEVATCDLPDCDGVHIVFYDDEGEVFETIVIEAERIESVVAALREGAERVRRKKAGTVQ